MMITTDSSQFECPSNADYVMSDRVGFCADVEGMPLGSLAYDPATEAEHTGTVAPITAAPKTPKVCADGRLSNPADLIPCLPNKVLYISAGAIMLFAVMGAGGGGGRRY